MYKVAVARGVISPQDGLVQQAADVSTEGLTEEDHYAAWAQQEQQQQASEGEGSVGEEAMKKEFCDFQIARGTTEDIKFWDANAMFYPNLYHVYVQVRGVRAGNARIEGLFSIANNITPGQRKSHHSINVRDLLQVKTATMTGALLNAAVRMVPNAGRKQQEGEEEEEEEDD
jgi:hypothetical protein